MVVVFGKGKTGEAVKRFLDSKGIENILIDDKDRFKLDRKVEEIVISPGVPFFHNIYKEAKKLAIPVISEIELADRFYKGKKIAITGTDGKTTTTSIIYHILKDIPNTFVGGNYGIPFVDIVDKTDENSTVVLELSSFQLYSCKNFKPEIAVVLNISKDHLDWHKKMSHYILSKYKITKNQTDKDFLILNYDDPIVRDFSSKADKYYFSTEQIPENLKGIYMKDYKKSDINTATFVLQIDKKIEFTVNTKLVGLHNIQNIMASILATYLYGLKIEDIIEKIESFEPLPHRIEFVKEIQGVKFYNDSKATTVQAVKRALESFDKGIILILGGINKGGDFSILGNILKERVKKVYIIGRDKDQIESMIKPFCETEKVDSLEEAVKKSFKSAENGDTVLLSPGCASFDMFKSYADRGNQFKDIVRKLDG
ncbi:MAG: UDP-N-acetylmuramoyl-L-alanine--D-glutamate ligase [Hydrogenothermaceae bacterium]|nr:UDP-N-acetylmuramoyl-L-alanine--D-glutamate ligase [Hydrogenothermaceae bacterium]